MMIRNLFPDARAVRKLNAWNGTAAQAADGVHWTYTLKEGQSNGTVGFGKESDVMDAVIVVMTDNPGAMSRGLENANTLVSTDTYVAALATRSGNKAITLQNGPITVLGVAVYESESVWNRVKTLYEAGEIPSPCVSWDWMPRP
ncbi:hypothetical protein [uncultured Bifidobacterium sp.]|uniref:hypothetical protein n=1 Tax=uncultured Bifidobacterium sp. TaxID=165187 RepID=UPI0025DAF13B|nr:hypothetical protein [uncultured Bifidobacterium sp.]